MQGHWVGRLPGRLGTTLVLLGLAVMGIVTGNAVARDGSTKAGDESATYPLFPLFQMAQFVNAYLANDFGYVKCHLAQLQHLNGNQTHTLLPTGESSMRSLIRSSTRQLSQRAYPSWRSRRTWKHPLSFSDSCKEWY